MIKLGQECEDIVTGYKGICVARTEWLNGCVRISLQPKLKNGLVPETQTFDEPQIKVIGRGVKLPATNTGGPIPAPVPQPRTKR